MNARRSFLTLIGASAAAWLPIPKAPLLRADESIE